MERDQSNKQDKQQSLGGSGSAENKGQTRSDQKNKMSNTTREDKQKIAGQTGLRPNQIADVDDLGGRSGREDSSGGSGDRMEDQNTNQGTERF